MNALVFVICLMCVNIATVLTMMCEKCINIDAYDTNSTCKGSAVECPSPEDMCLAFFIRDTTFDGHFIRAVYQRDCGKSSECEKTGRQSFANEYYEFISSCCDNNNCTPILPHFAPANKRVNGHECLSSLVYSMDDNEDENTLLCSGDDTMCSHFFEISSNGSVAKHQHGCASETYCTTSRTSIISKTMYEVDRSNISCTKSSLVRYVEEPGQSCYECHTLRGQICPAQRSACLPDQDVCLHMYVLEIHDGEETSEIIKRCGKSSECSRSGTIHSATKTIALNTTCCNSRDCIPPTPTKPVLSKEKNGLSCPSCFSGMAVGCLDRELIECTGDEKHCVHYRSQVTQEHLIISESLHGCTTANICTTGNSLVQYQWKIMKMEINCTSNSNNVHINFLLSLFIPLGLMKLFG